ncbi:RNA polymerase sigma factor [Pedobacter sp. AW31-3R]|uniref:RNA polymerase sigma factor n=1 Tax=Pedobacter sp. AW31-3R TaxID=3445781 RepID=UPI003FA194C9
MVSYNKLSDQDLSILLAEGDEAAFKEIYNRYKAVLYVHAYNRLRNAEEVHDIIHELFATLWNKKGTLEFKNSLSGYLYTSIRNRILDFISHQKVESAYISGFQDFINRSESTTDHLVRQKDLSTLIEAEISLLPLKMREVFEMSRKQHLSHREIAEELHLSEKTVKKHINNALKILRTRLGVVVYLCFLFNK